VRLDAFKLFFACGQHNKGASKHFLASGEEDPRNPRNLFLACGEKKLRSAKRVWRCTQHTFLRLWRKTAINSNQNVALAQQLINALIHIILYPKT